MFGDYIMMMLNEGKVGDFISEILLPGIKMHGTEIKNLAKIYQGMSPGELKKVLIKVSSEYKMKERDFQDEIPRNMTEGVVRDFLGGVWEWTKGKLTSMYSWATQGFTPYILLAALVYLTGGGYILLAEWGEVAKVFLLFLWTLFGFRVYDRIDNAMDAEQMERDDEIERERKKLGMRNPYLDDNDEEQEHWAYET
jgi:hypothetical protein